MNLQWMVPAFLQGGIGHVREQPPPTEDERRVRRLGPCTYQFHKMQCKMLTASMRTFPRAASCLCSSDLITESWQNLTNRTLTIQAWQCSWCRLFKRIWLSLKGYRWMLCPDNEVWLGIWQPCTSSTSFQQVLSYSLAGYQLLPLLFNKSHQALSAINTLLDRTQECRHRLLCMCEVFMTRSCLFKFRFGSSAQCQPHALSTHRKNGCGPLELMRQATVILTPRGWWRNFWEAEHQGHVAKEAAHFKHTPCFKKTPWSEGRQWEFIYVKHRQQHAPMLACMHPSDKRHCI